MDTVWANSDPCFHRMCLSICLTVHLSVSIESIQVNVSISTGCGSIHGRAAICPGGWGTDRLSTMQQASTRHHMQHRKSGMKEKKTSRNMSKLKVLSRVRVVSQSFCLRMKKDSSSTYNARPLFITSLILLRMTIENTDMTWKEVPAAGGVNS